MPLNLQPKRNNRRPPSTFDIWQFNRTLSQRLLWWAGSNVVVGLWLQQRRNRFWRGVAMQSISWGAINASIAIIGAIVTSRRRANQQDPHNEELQTRETRNLVRILWVNSGLDVIYVIGGLALAGTRGREDRLMRGNGWGVVIQGGFLLFFDLIHALIASADEEGN